MRDHKVVIREAGVLLIAVVLLFSATSVVANTKGNNQAVLVNDGQGYTKVKTDPMSSDRNVLWDNGLPDAVNGVSCVYWAAQPLDREVVDDFDVTGGAWSIDGGSLRMLTYAGTGSASVLGVNVYFYEDDGANKPKLTAFASPTATFTASDTGSTYFTRPEILVEVSFDAVELVVGKWWVCFQPIVDDNVFWLTSAMIGEPVWLDYPDQGYTRWTAGSVVFGADYSVSYTLTGSAGAQPKLEITSIKTGFGITAVLKNTGDADATNVAWSITAEGGLVFPKLKSDVLPTLAVGETATIKMMVLGFGSAVFTIAANCDEGSEVEGNQTGFVLLFFVLGM